MKEKFDACKKAEFPICLEKTLDLLFRDKNRMVSVAEKMGFETRHVSSSTDIFRIYTDLLSSLNKALGKNGVAVIEFEALKEMASMHCAGCPLYELETKRWKEGYAHTFPVTSEQTQND